MPKSFLRQARVIATSQTFNLDSTATPVDEPLFNSGPTGCRILRVYALYRQISQTVAGGNFSVGITSGGAEIVSACAYEDSAAIGDTTEATLVTDVVAPNTTVWVDHVGVAITQTGTAAIIIEYVYDE